MMNTQQILDQYKPFYRGQENYYHNFNHATWVVEKGLEILENFDVQLCVKEAYVHAMACHDAGHLNGLQKNDRENVDIALSIYKNHGTRQTTMERTSSYLIIDSTCVPYLSLETLRGQTILSIKDMWIAIKVARDVDHLGIIGIADDKQREIALTGFMRELLRKNSKEDILNSYKDLTNDFFEKLRFSFYTEHAKEWAGKNLDDMRKWQLDFTPKALELA